MAISEVCKFEVKETIDKYVEERGISRNAASKELAEWFSDILGKEVKRETIRQKDKRARGIAVGTNVPTSKKTVKKIFNKEAGDGIEWASYTWNPVTGCKHGCPYCYARNIANMRYAEKFEPTFRSNRLSEPKDTPTPKDEKKRKVFVCSMADLFGEWVPADWINAVFESVKENPQWKYYFLTKNPNRYMELNFPPNCRAGATADTQKRASTALEIFKNLYNKPYRPKKLFLSCEPLETEITLGERIKYIDALIIGARSKTAQMPELQPKRKWVINLINEADQAGKPVFLKSNLKVFRRFI